MSARPNPTVLLTGLDPEHDHVTRVLADRGLIDVVVRVHAKPTPPVDRLRRSVRRFGYGGAAGRLALRAVQRLSGESNRRDREVRSILGDGGVPVGLDVHEVTGVNSAATKAILGAFEPGVLCIYGTSVVSDATLAIARGPAINLHTGISPRYRGADCAFWPLHNGEPEWLGATVHECTSALDGGAIYATAHARLSGDEGIGGVFARCVAVGAETLADVLEHLDTIEPCSQDLGLGKEYRAVMRGPMAEYRVWSKLRHGLLRDRDPDREPSRV